MPASDPTMYPRDEFRLRVESNLLVLQRLEATRPMAAPDERWVDVTPQMYCTDPDLAAQISRRLTSMPSPVIQGGGDYAVRRAAAAGALMGALIGAICIWAGMYLRAVLQ